MQNEKMCQLLFSEVTWREHGLQEVRQEGGGGDHPQRRVRVPPGLLQVLRLQGRPLHPEGPLHHGRQAQALLHQGLQRVRESKFTARCIVLGKVIRKRLGTPKNVNKHRLQKRSLNDISNPPQFSG